MRFDHPRGLRQSMSWLHTWSGLLLGWLLFAIYVTGALSYVRNEITFWMQPELHKADSRQIAFDRALQVLSREAANATQWTLTLPGPRNPTLGLSWQSAAAGNTPERGGRPEGAGQREGGADGATPNRAREGSAAWREGAGER
ncbi:MAG: PepSY domain-containing protein, partial [Zoogloeaceae bacterium]|nr:PepSY domain-containing protein [Zoogloeaceae bacterium]